MRSPPFGIERFYFFVSEPIRLELAPGIDAAHVAKRQIARFPHVPLRTVLRVGTTRNAEDAAGGFTIRFITRIMCCIKALICVELPLLAGNPRQDPALDGAEVGSDQHVAASDRQRR